MSGFTEFTVTLELLDYWHAGSSRGRGPVYDAEVVRDRRGLPYLPGRTLRGLLREGLLTAEESAAEGVPPGTVADWFGGEDNPGRLRVGNAELDPELAAWAKTPGAGVRSAIEALYAPLASTAINPDTGTADDQTLRTLEVVVPVTLRAPLRLEGPASPASDATRALALAAEFVRGLGKGRRRGLGRVRVTIEPAGSGEVSP